MKKNNKKDIWFTRWGNLNPVKHKESRKADEDAWVHIAPRYKGIYAFPRGYIEPFLIGGSYGRHHKKYLKENGHKILGKYFYNEDGTIKKKYLNLMKKFNIRQRDITDIDGDTEWYIAYNVRPIHFEYKGELWHHLGDYVDKKDILDTCRFWVKTTYDVYVKALHNCDVSERFLSYMDDKDHHGNPHTYPNRYSKDYYEVFIEKVK